MHAYLKHVDSVGYIYMAGVIQASLTLLPNWTYMLWTPVNYKIKVILLIHRNRLFSDIVRIIRRMRDLNSPSFGTQELSQSLSIMAMQMRMMMSMLRCGLASGRINTDKRMWSV
jgi:hypothetical protein